MSRRSQLALVIARAAMEVCCLYAWCSMTLAMGGARRYPLPDALGVFVGGAALTRFCSGHRERWRAPLQAAAGLLGVLHTLRELFAPSEPFMSFFWLGALAGHAGAQWFEATAFCAWLLVMWIAGCRFAQRSPAYLDVCARFDRGVLWLFALLFVKLLLRTQPGVWHAVDRSDGLVLPYFVFGLGRRSGLPARVTDTPLEYGQRLKQRLAVASAEVDSIVALFNARVYGAELPRERVHEARGALWRLRSPRLWPQRMAAWLSAEN